MFSLGYNALVGILNKSEIMGIVSTDASKPLPAFIANHKDNIRDIFNVNKNQPGKWKYDSQLWLSSFKDDPVLLVRLSEVMKECPESITRQQVQDYAHKLLLGTVDANKNLFIACMLWGYGPDPNGPKNTKLALNASKINDVLLHSVEFLQFNKVMEAYEEFNLKGCGPAYFTKFFYFVGKVYNLKPLPLISDSHVASYLEYLGETERISGLNFFKVMSRGKQGKISRIGKHTSGYIDYINTLNVWADGIGCPADNIEYFLYLSDKKGSNNQYRQNKEEDKVKRVTRVGDLNTLWSKAAKEYCENNELSNEWAMIEDMEQPKNWNLRRKDSDESPNKPEYWFKRAYQGMLITMWKFNKKTGWPESERMDTTLEQAVDEYIKTVEGSTWQKRHTPYWLKKTTFDTPQPQIAPPTQSSGNITVTLSPIQINQVKKLAEEWEVEEQAVVRILIILGLNKIVGNN